MNTLFETVKSAVSVPKAAAFYGLKANRSGMIRCLYHPDHNPSMKLYDDHFYCFGCCKCGDVITLTAQLFQLSPLKAAEKLAADFRIIPPPEGSAGKSEPAVMNSEKDDKLLYHIRLLSEYRNMVRDMKIDYALTFPVHTDISPYFRFAWQELPWIEIMNDCMNSSDEHMRIWADQELSKLHLYERMEYLLVHCSREVRQDGYDGNDAA